MASDHAIQKGNIFSYEIINALFLKLMLVLHPKSLQKILLRDAVSKLVGHQCHGCTEHTKE